MKSLLLVMFLVMLSSGAEVTVDPEIPGGEWTIKDEEGDVCMKMSLSAKLEVLHGDKPVQYNIDQSFAASGLCAKPFRQFTLTSPDPSRTILKELQLTFLFDYTRDIYTLPQIMAVWLDTIHAEDWEKDIKQGDNLLNETVGQGKSYKCNHVLRFDLEGGYGRVYLWNIELVPFMEDYHYEAQECSGVTKTVHQSGLPTGCVVAIIFAGLGGLIIFSAVCIGFGYYHREKIRRMCGNNDGSSGNENKVTKEGNVTETSGLVGPSEQPTNYGGDQQSSD